MSPFSTLFALLTLLISFSAGAAVERASTCNAADVAFVKQRITHPVYFCTFYLHSARSRSPLVALTAARLTSACGCITAAAPKKTLQTSTTVPSTTLCSSADSLIVRNEYKNPTGFCNFWTAVPRHISPIPGRSVKEINKACRCLSTQVAIPIGSSTSQSSASGTFTSAADTLTISTGSSTPVSVDDPTSILPSRPVADPTAAPATSDSSLPSGTSSQPDVPSTQVSVSAITTTGSNIPVSVPTDLATSSSDPVAAATSISSELSGGTSTELDGPSGTAGAVAASTSVTTDVVGAPSSIIPATDDASSSSAPAAATDTAGTVPSIISPTDDASSSSTPTDDASSSSTPTDDASSSGTPDGIASVISSSPTDSGLSVGTSATSTATAVPSVFFIETVGNGAITDNSPLYGAPDTTGPVSFSPSTFSTATPNSFSLDVETGYITIGDSDFILGSSPTISYTSEVVTGHLNDSNFEPLKCSIGAGNMLQCILVYQAFIFTFDKTIFQVDPVTQYLYISDYPETTFYTVNLQVVASGSSIGG